MKVPDVGRNLVPDTWTADGEGALPKLGPCPHDNSCVGCRGTETATSRLFCVEFDDIVEVCMPSDHSTRARATDHTLMYRILLKWISQYAVRAYTTADSAVSYLNHARIA